MTPDRIPTDLENSISGEPTRPTTSFSRAFGAGEIGELTDEELFEIAWGSLMQIKSRLKGKSTERLMVDDSPVTFTEAEIEEFTRLPVGSSKTPEEAKATAWRISLVSSDPKHKPPQQGRRLTTCANRVQTC